jgi:predicted DNA-binding transcriptional regulator AlpA
VKLGLSALWVLQGLKNRRIRPGTCNGMYWHAFATTTLRVPKTDSLGTTFMQLLDLDDLALQLGRSPETIKKDMRRNRLAVPPRLHIPGTRLLRWRQCDVDVWLESFAPSQTR